MGNSEFNKEQEFLALLQKTLEQAKRSGARITRDEVRESFGAFSLDETQLEQVESYLRAHRIAVQGSTDEMPELTEEEGAFLSSYLEALGDIPKLPGPVLDALRISAMAGEPSAQRELTEQMLGNVVDIARLYAGQGLSLEELISAGNEALATGVTLLGHLESPQEVDGELGRRIMDGMEDAISLMLDENALDRELEDLANRIAAKASELAGVMGRKVTAQELAGEGEVTPEQIEDARRLTGGRIEDLE